MVASADENVVSHTEVETKKLKYLIETVGFKDVIREHMPGKSYIHGGHIGLEIGENLTVAGGLDHIFSSHDIMGDFLSSQPSNSIGLILKLITKLPLILLLILGIVRVAMSISLCTKYCISLFTSVILSSVKKLRGVLFKR